MPKVIAKEVILRAEADAIAKGAYEKGIRVGRAEGRGQVIGEMIDFYDKRADDAGTDWIDSLKRRHKE